jgi:NDP-sugar pyrophosphorylase family protein
VQILSKRFIEYLPKTGVFDVISQGYEVALKAGELVLGQVHDGFWHDIRSPRFYFEAVKDFLLTDPARDITGLYALRRHLGKTQSLIPAGKEITGEFVVVGPVIQVSRHSIGGGAHVGPFAVLEDRVEIAQNARVSHSVILPGARIDTGEIISRMIVGKGFRLSLDAPSA